METVTKTRKFRNYITEALLQSISISCFILLNISYLNEDCHLLLLKEQQQNNKGPFL